MSTPTEPRVWLTGDPEPDEPGLQVRDGQGDVWQCEIVLGGGRVWTSPETALATWAYIAKKWPPLTEERP